MEYLSPAIAYFIRCFLTWISSCCRKFRLNRNLKKFNKKSEEWLSKDRNFIPIIINYQLKTGFFKAKAHQKQYKIQIPNDKEEELQRLNFKLVKLEGQDLSNEFTERLCCSFGEKISESDAKELILRYVELTADDFINDIKEGKLRFNKYLYGVLDVVSERNGCVLHLYESDYFTFKATTKIFNSISNNLILKSISRDAHINEFTPFLNSIGVGGFIIINRGDGDELVFGYRSKKSCQSGGYWHFSFDETFTRDDKIGEKGNPSLEGCVLRAIDEELGISGKEQDLCGVKSNMRLFDAGIIKSSDNRFEFEVCGFARVNFSSKYTFDDFFMGYRFAKDAEIETQTIDFINIRDKLDTFLCEKTLSPEAYHLAQHIKWLYDYKILNDIFEE
ncbi:MAG: hypothetical protein IK075_09040 [Prevotella sp.]|nr:hypothetical protein [Prevotella sp.]